VLRRWHQLFKGTVLTQKYQNNQPLDKFQLAMVKSTEDVYKKRLIDISWFMRSLNEPIARQGYFIITGLTWLKFKSFTNISDKPEDTPHLLYKWLF
jgi:hypothetical protein